MFELTSNNSLETVEMIQLASRLHELADLQLAMVGGGNGAASLD